MRLNNNQIVAICKGIKALTTPETKYFKGTGPGEGCENVTNPTRMSTSLYQPHCLIAFIYIFAGANINDCKTGYCEETAMKLKIKVTSKALTILRSAQNKQDGGETWHKCIDYIIGELS